MSEKNLKKCSASLVIREMQIKTTLIFYFTPVRRAKNEWQVVLERMWNKRNIPSLHMGMQPCIATMEISVPVPQKDGSWSSSDLAIAFLGIYIQKTLILSQRYLLNHLNCCCIHNIQKLETEE